MDAVSKMDGPYDDKDFEPAEVYRQVFRRVRFLVTKPFRKCKARICKFLLKCITLRGGIVLSVHGNRTLDGPLLDERIASIERSVDVVLRLENETEVEVARALRLCHLPIPSVTSKDLIRALLRGEFRPENLTADSTCETCNHRQRQWQRWAAAKAMEYRAEREDEAELAAQKGTGVIIHISKLRLRA